MVQGDVPTSRGGPFQRRREKRQLEQLAKASERDTPTRTSSAHIRVIEHQNDAEDQDLEGQETDSPVAQTPQRRTGSFRVRAVPIDQPLDE
jgi:hypothetical protein